ncbi:unnamed protein product [Dracunculus medinensis]|uniref:Endo/exonuclease/phosphatase domain-containing protein n=1 Tax=Dracunculus medinensis TaxID=318479 RepID=A0A0N4UJQ7_DRAME|nr:unnamed protein product [Dracunculus medinensis]
MAPKKVAVYGAVSNNDVSCLNKTIEDLTTKKSTDDESATADRLLAENIVVVAGFKTEFIKEVHSHGRKGTGRPRVLKIRLDKHMAMSVLRNKDVRSIVPPGSFLRKDLTKRELLLDKQLRKECYTRNQSFNLKKLILTDNPNNISCINETWLNDSIDNRELNFDGFIVSRKDRTINSSNIRGGELIMLIPDYYKFITFDDYVCSPFESLIIKIYLKYNRNISLLNLYRPPGYGSKFTRDLYNLLLKSTLIGTDYIIVGDLNMPNIDWENSCLKSSNKFEED